MHGFSPCSVSCRQFYRPPGEMDVRWRTRGAPGFPWALAVRDFTVASCVAGKKCRFLALVAHDRTRRSPASRRLGGRESYAAAAGKWRRAARLDTPGRPSGHLAGGSSARKPSRPIRKPVRKPLITRATIQNEDRKRRRRAQSLGARSARCLTAVMAFRAAPAPTLRAPGSRAERLPDRRGIRAGLS